jgi:hypothetical protein
MPSRTFTPRVTRREQLRRELLTAVDSLARRRADLVSEGFIADYVALHWLEWNGGTLRLTVRNEHLRADADPAGPIDRFAGSPTPESGTRRRALSAVQIGRLHGLRFERRSLIRRARRVRRRTYASALQTMLAS